MIRTIGLSRRWRPIFVGGVALAALHPATALAQSTTPVVPAEAGSAAQNEEIVVTAQKRAQNAQDVPIAITALDSNQLAVSGVSGTADLKSLVPALNVTTATGGYGLPRIRGIGATGQGPSIENPVAVYVDGVYYGAAFGVLQSLYDTDQVAVLKGPQGTLFGRNATGGLIQITTLAPSFTWTGKGEVGYGNYNTYNASGFASGGLSQTIAISLAGQYEDRDHGFGRNVLTHNYIQDGKTWVGRGKLLWQPDGLTSVTLSGDFNGRDAAEPAFRNFQLNALGQNVPAQITALGGDTKRDIYSDLDPSLRARQWGASLTASRDLGGVTLKSITAYRKSRLDFLFDPDGTALARLRVANNQFDQQFTQELNLVSTAKGPFQWVIGGFYMHDRSGLDPAHTTGLLTFGDNGYSDYRSNIKLDSYAAFAEGTYALANDTNLITGIRYTSDHRTADARSINFVGATNTLTTIPTSATDKTDKLTWRASIDHRFSPELLMYASYNRGFRSGGFIPQTNPLVSLRPEVVDAFEIGAKSDLFDRHVRLNLAGYYYDEKNIQVMQVISGVQNVYNANGAHIYGLDADVTWRVTSGLRLFGGLNYTHARYTDFSNAVISYPFPLTTGFVIPTGQSCLGTFGSPFTQLGGNCLLRGDASGNKLQNTPEFTASLGASYDLVTGVGKFTLGGNYYYNDGFVGSPDERVKQGHYNTLDASLTWRAPSGHYFARAWGRNLTDAFYRTQIGATNSGDNGTYAAPRTYGLTLGFSY